MNISVSVFLHVAVTPSTPYCDTPGFSYQQCQLYLLQNVHTGAVVNPAYYSMGIYP